MGRDIRVAIDLFTHPKFNAMHEPEQLGLIRLWAWAAVHRPDGNLSDLLDKVISRSVGLPDNAVSVFAEYGWIDGNEMYRTLHDWATHQGWVIGSKDRSATAKDAGRKGGVASGLARRAHREQREANVISLQAEKRGITSNEACASSKREPPSPSPSPKSKRRTPLTPQGGNVGGATPIRKRKPGRTEYPAGFVLWWPLYPRKVAKAAAAKAWAEVDAEANTDAWAAHTGAMARGEWKGRELDKIPHPATYLRANDPTDLPESGRPEQQPKANRLLTSEERLEHFGG